MLDVLADCGRKQFAMCMDASGALSRNVEAMRAIQQRADSPRRSAAPSASHSRVLRPEARYAATCYKARVLALSSVHSCLP